MRGSQTRLAHKLKGSWLLAIMLISSQLLYVACGTTTNPDLTLTSKKATPLVTNPAQLDSKTLQTAAAQLNPSKELNEPDYANITAGGVTPHPAGVGSVLTDLMISTTITDKSINISGTLEGGHFGLKIPSNWNGEVVWFAHGYRQSLNTSGTIFGGGTSNQTSQNNGPSGNPAIQALFANVLSQKYAYGYSDFAKPYGYAVKSGIESIQLLKHWLELALPVKRSYLVGESMGGNVVMGLLEKYPQDYAGALSLCGVVAGWYEETRFISDFRVIYDYFTKNLGAPIVLPHAGAIDPNHSDPTYTAGVVYGSLNALFNRARSDTATAHIIQQIAQVTGANPDFITFLTLLFAANPDTEDLALTTGGEGYSNQAKVYKGSDDDAALNAGVQRIAAQPAATTYLNSWYSPVGNFKAKLLSVHNLIDPLVPYEFEGLLKARVTTQNNMSSLTQQVVDSKAVNPNAPLAGGPLHCYFTAGQLNFAWNGLRTWVENGIKPQDGLNITDKQ